MAMKKHNRGVTLIEAMITMMILMVGIMGFTAAFTHSLQQATASRNDSQALYMATSFMEELRARPYEDWADGSLDALAAQFTSNFNGEVSNADGFYTLEADTVKIGSDVFSYQDVSIKVTWLNAREEQDEAGFQNGSAKEAFVFEVRIADTISDDIYGEETQWGGS